MMGLLRKGFILMMLVLFLALVGVLVFAGDGLFGAAVERYGPVAFSAPVRFEQAELSALGGSASITDFHAGTEDNPRIDVGRAAVDVGAMALIGGRVHIQNAELDATTLHLIVREDGTLSFDPGPPPEDVQAEKPLPPREKPLPKQENRDFVQIALEYWGRAQHYKDYYDRVKDMRGEGDGAEENAALERVKYPGKPAYIEALQAGVAEASEGVFWLERAAITGFDWKTLDERTGQPILPAIADFSFELTDLGTPPTDGHPYSGFTGSGRLVDGGAVQFQLQLSRTDLPSTASFSLTGLPIESVLGMMRRSLPFRVRGGVADLTTTDLRFAEDLLQGKVRLELRGAEVLPKQGSPQVLGVAPNEFTTLLNGALQEQPVAFLIILGGTPSAPSFTIQNETDIGDMLGGAVKAEVERRAQEFVDEKVGELEGRVGEMLEDAVGDQLKQGLDVGGILGGKKGKKKDG